MAIVELIPADTIQAPSLTPKQEAFVHSYIETGNGCEAYRRSYKADGMSQHSVEVEASKLLRHPEVTLRLARLRKQNAEHHQITVDHITQMLLEDRALAHARGQSSAAVSATMGLAKLHGLGQISDKKSDDRQKQDSKSFEEMTDVELWRLAKATEAKATSSNAAD